MTRRIVSWAMLLAGAAFLAWVAYPLVHGHNNGRAAERDKVSSAATRQIAELNSLDAANLDAGMARWLDDSTGPLHDALVSEQQSGKAKAQKAGTTATGKVTALAVTTLDVKTGDATVIAAVRVQVTGPGAAPSEQRRRYQAGLSRTGTGWKLKSLIAIPPAGA